ncbi:Separase [Bertholletia excelsa]
METESALISKLQSADLHHIYRLCSDYLQPFADLNPSKSAQVSKKSKKSSKTSDEHHQNALRSLAKKFLPFINRALSIIPKRLSENPKVDEQIGLELFETYNLCLNCLSIISSQLACKPYAVHSQRAGLVHCYESWGRYEDAENEGFSVLESLRGIVTADSGSKVVKKRRQFVPHFSKDNSDQSLAFLIVEIQSKEEGDYQRVLVMLDEVTPWLRVLDAKTYEKLHRVLITHLDRCTLLLVGKHMDFDKDLVHRFFMATVTEYSESSIKDQILKFARRICSSLFSKQDSQTSSTANLLVLVVDSTIGQCKVDAESKILELEEFVHYCAYKCRTTARSFCHAFATHLSKIAGDLCQVLSPFNLILSLYASGLFISDYVGQSRPGNAETTIDMKDESVIRFFLNNDGVLHDLAALLSGLKGLIAADNTTHQIETDIVSTQENSRGYKMKNGKLPLICSYNALKFLCQPIAEFVTSARKDIIAEIGGASFVTNPCSIQDAFLLFCDVSLLCNGASEKESDASDDCNKTILSVAVAALTLSFRTGLHIKKSVNFLKQIISTDWIEASGLKFLFASLHNIGVTLYRNKQVEEASKVLKLSCRASWSCVSYLCEAFVKQSNRFCRDWSEASLAKFVCEACATSALLVDILYQCGSHENVSAIICYSLENWCAAENILNKLPSPAALVKQWVKMNCKLCQDPNADQSAKTLSSLLPSSPEVLRRLGIILEQELSAYYELSALNPRLCQRMKLVIIDVLLKEVYIKNENYLERCRILIAKGRELRATGIEGLNGCIQCLSDAISIMNVMKSRTVPRNILACHQLAIAYSLRALCNLEAEPNSKQPYHDIRAALNLWLSPDCLKVNVKVYKDHLLLPAFGKGNTQFHPDIYELLIRLFKKKNVPLEKYLALLWQCRRVGHALCASPVSEEFITTVVQHYGEHSNSVDFWISCMKGSWPLEVGFQHSFFSMFTNLAHWPYHNKESFRSDIKVDEVKQYALDLTSKVPLRSDSVFLAAYLYNDLSKRMLSNGKMIEALSYAKDGHRLCGKLLQEKFRYSFEQQSEIHDENGEIIQKRHFNLSSFQMCNSAATVVWSQDSDASLEGCILTPWNVLQCYVESTLQVGIIYELIGNGFEAETLLQWGKNISCFQGLPLFQVAFSSVLGRLYRKQQQGNLAEKELQSAKQILADCCTSISCSKCRLLLEVSVDLQLGDLFRSYYDGNTGNTSVNRLYFAENLYKSALDKLNLSEWKNSISHPDKIDPKDTNAHSSLAPKVRTYASNQLEIESRSRVEAVETKMGSKRSTKIRKAKKPSQHGQCLMVENNSRVTRSRYHSQRNNGSILSEIPVGLANCSDDEHPFSFPDAKEQKGPPLDSTSDSRSEITCFCNKMKCWYCLPSEIIESGCLNNFVRLIWEFVRRQLSLRLLIGMGKCMVFRGEIHEAHEIFLQSIQVLVSRNPFSAHSSIPVSFLLDFLGKDIPGDSFAVERAAILYNICWCVVKSYSCKSNRTNCCDLTHVQISRIMSWLMFAFVLCREVPILYKRFKPSLGSLLFCHLASYFHQSSVSAHFNQQHFSCTVGKQEVSCLANVEGFCTSGTSCIGSETLNLLRLAPESPHELEGYVLRFFQGLPSTAIICLSLFGGAFASLLTELLGYSSCTRAWILLSRLSSNSPTVILLPVDSSFEEAFNDDISSCTKILFEEQSSSRRWKCPWGSTVIDDIAPVFRVILEENYLSSSMHPSEDTKTNRSLWWMQRKSLDQRLGKFLRDLEDSWFGIWRFLFLGEWSSCKLLESVLKKLADDLKDECELIIHDSLLKVIIGAADYAHEREESILQLILNKGCYTGGMQHHSERGQGSSSTCNGTRNMSKKVFQRILEAARELEEEQCLRREPIILVLDFDIQMLPWENLPVLRKQEVYRMPSIGSIFAILEKCCTKEHIGKVPVSFPLIDPLDAFYLLNPGGDLSRTQVEFEEWFRDQNLKGKSGCPPSIEELAVALRSHDLFIYFGHGSGTQYFPRHEILKLENCAGTLLMGCSSGSLSLNGCYTPQGVPLLYLLAGSPVTVANLWEVTDKDIDRFGKAMLESWLRERSTASLGCAQCNLLAKKLNSMRITGNQGKSKRKTSKKDMPENFDINLSYDCCNHGPKIGSFMSQARDACILPFLIGASPVCYGVPTGISRKKDM